MIFGQKRRKQSRLLKRFERFSNRVERKLQKDRGDDFASHIRKEARSEFKKIIPEIPNFHGTINIFRVIIIVSAWMVAWYKPMKRSGLSVEEAVSIFFEITDDIHRSIPKPIRWFIGKLFFTSCFLKIAHISSKNIYNHPKGWKIRFYKESSNRIDSYFIANECGVVKFFIQQGVPELAHYCNFVDYIQSEIFGFGMQQVSCIGLGDRRCIEEMKKGRNTEIPKNLRSIVQHRTIGKNDR